MSVLSDRRFGALLVEVDARREAVARDLRCSWPAWGTGWVEDAVQEAFAALPRQQRAIERYASQRCRRPTVDDLEAKWRVAAQARMKDLLRQHQGRAKDGPRTVLALDQVAETAAPTQARPTASPQRQLFEEALMALDDDDDRRYARIRILEMSATAAGERVLTMAEARAELGWSQRRWNDRGAAVKRQLAPIFERVGSPQWCAEHRAALEGWVAAQLDPHTEQRVALHLEACETCSAAAARLQRRLHTAAHHVFDPTLPSAAAGGLGALGWLKAKLGLTAALGSSTTAGPTGAAAGAGAGAGVGGGSLLGSALTGSAVVKVCATAATAGCLAAVGAPLVEDAAERPRPTHQPAASTRTHTIAKAPAAPAPAAPGGFAQNPQPPGTATTVANGSGAAATASQGVKSMTATIRAARSSAGRAAQAFTPGSQLVDSHASEDTSNQAAVADAALTPRTSATHTVARSSATTPTGTAAGAKSTGQTPGAAKTADQAFGP